jgi:hypothetical protein
MGWKKFAKTKKVGGGQVECGSHVDSFFDIEGVVHYEFLCQGQTVNCWYYLEVLKCLRENVRRRRPQLWRNSSWFLHHKNVPAHASLLIHDFLANMNASVLPQPPYSPDVTPADVFLFHKTKIHFERTMISDSSRNCGKFVDRAMCDPKKGVPGLFPEVATMLGAVHQCRRGIL